MALCKIRIGSKFFAPTLGLTVAMLLTLALLLSLGGWQVHRLIWKEALIARMDASMSAPPMAFPDLLVDPAKLDYRRTSVTGEFMNDQEIYLGGRPHPGQVGYNVLTPFHLSDGRLLIVNRGWVSEDKLRPAKRAASQVAGPVTVTGILRLPKEPNWLTPPPDPPHRLFYAYDMDGFSEILNHKKPLPLVLEADAASTVPGGPEGGVTVVNFPNNHLQYAMTWFSLALALVVMWGFASMKNELELAKDEDDEDES